MTMPTSVQPASEDSRAQVQEADASRFAAFHAAQFARGVLIPPSPHEAWFVSAAFGTRELDEMMVAIRAAFAVIAATWDDQPMSHSKEA